MAKYPLTCICNFVIIVIVFLFFCPNRALSTEPTNNQLVQQTHRGEIPYIGVKSGMFWHKICTIKSTTFAA